MHLPRDLGNFPVLLMGLGWWIAAGNKVGLLDRAQLLLSATPGRAEGEETVVLSGSSDPGLPPKDSLPSGGSFVMKLRFFHLWSICT